MKKLYLLIAIIIAIPLTMSAQILNKVAPNSNIENTTSIKADALVKFDKTLISKDVYPQFQGKFTYIADMLGYFYPIGNAQVTPMCYDPSSNALFLVTSDYTRVNETDEAVTSSIYLNFSNDKGNTWQKVKIYEEYGILVVSLAVTVNNPTKSTDINKCLVTVFSRVGVYETMPEKTYRFKGVKIIFNTGNGFDDFENYQVFGPADNNPSNQQYFGSGKALSFDANNQSNTVYYSSLQPQNSDLYPPGKYGYIRLGLEDGQGLIDESSGMPNEYNLNIWRAPTATGHYNDQMLMDNDDKGNLYACFTNFKGESDERRSIMVFKSTDLGKTWPTVDSFPSQLIDQYISANSLENFFYAVPYHTHGFAVTGENKYSVVIKFLELVSGGTPNVYDNALFEFYKEDAEWKLRKIASLPTGKQNFYDPMIVLNSKRNEDVEDIKDSIQQNLLGMEIQLAKTADGQNLLLKYIAKNHFIPFDPIVTLVNGPMIDTLYSSDIFVSYRSIGNNGNWSTPLNITNDLWFNRGTYIPNIIPSLNEVPIMESTNIEFTNPENLRVINKYPRILQNMIIDPIYTINQHLLLSTFDATDPNTNIANPEHQPSSINDQININIANFDVYPNPASSTVQVSFKIEEMAYVKIEVYNVMGQLVKTLRNYGLTNSDYTGFSSDLSDLNPGTYYVTMTANGSKTTKPLSIVR